MSAMDDTTTLGRARVSFAKQSDIDEFADMLAKFERGEIGPDQWRGFPPLRGAYRERNARDAQMMGLKNPQGPPTQRQLVAAAGGSAEKTRGFSPVTPGDKKPTA